MITKRTYIPGKPRNKKLTNVTSGSASVGKTEFNQVAGESHTHPNKGVLDQITEAMLVAALRDMILSTDTETELSDENYLSSLRTIKEITERSISKITEDEAKEVITFLKGIIAGGTSYFVNLIASGKITAENIDVNDTLKTQILQAIVRAELQDAILKGQLNSETFTSGFLGNGFRLSKINGRWVLELDDLIVRKTMQIYELIVERVRYQSGWLLHGPFGGKLTSVTDGGTYWRCEHDSVGDCITGAFVLCQNFRVGSAKENPDGSTTFNGVSVKRYWRRATSYGRGWFNLSKTHMEAGSAIPEVGDEVGVLGHEDNPNWQNAIVLVSTGPNSPYIAHYAGVNSYSTAGKEVVREGNLSGIVDPDFGQLSGFGLYAQNVFLKGIYRLTNGQLITDFVEDSINLSVSNKVDKDEILASINLSEEGIKISGEKIQFTGSVSFQSAAKEVADTAVNDLQIGGRNYLLNSAGFNDISANNQTTWPIVKGLENGINWVYGKNNSNNKYYVSTYAPLFSSSYFSKNITGQTITVSVEVMSTVAMDVGLSTLSHTISYTTLSPNTWTRISTTSPNSERMAGLYVREDENIPLQTKLYYRNWQVEIGNKMTDRTPAPEDVDAKIADTKLYVEYSTDGTSWHTTFQTNDIYMRQKTGVNGTWTGAIKIVGKDGTSVSIKGKVPTSANLPSSASLGDGYIAEDTGHLWVWMGSWTDAGQIQGDNGANSYIHIAYADDSLGGGFSHDPSGKSWIGIYADFSAIDSDNPSDYTWMYAKGQQGDTGASAPLLYLSASAQVMKCNPDNTPQTGQTISIEAKLQNVSGTATFVATPYNDAGTALTAITLGGSGNTKTLTNSQWLAAYKRIEVVATLGSLTDKVTIYRVTDGATGAKGTDAIVGFLTNESVTLQASSAGIVSSFTPANGEFWLYNGTTKVTTGVTYSKVSETGCTASITSAGVISVSAMTADNATAVFRAVYNGVTIDKVLTLSKSKAGADGISITLVDVEFAKNTNPTTAPTTGWSTTAPALSEGEQLWTRTKTTYSSGNPTYSTPANITPKKGDTGAVGQGVESVTEEFAISSSKTVQPTSGWSTTQPAWIQGQYIWSRVKVVYKNPAQTIYTGYAVSSEWEAVNDLQIGGRNYLLNSAGFNGISANNQTTWPIVKGLENGINWVYGKNNSNNKYYVSTYAPLFSSSYFSKNISGKLATVSVEVMSTVDMTVRLQQTGGSSYDIVAGKWTTISHTSISNRMASLIVLEGDAIPLETKLYYRNWKVELGNKATDWSPAPENVQAAIDAAVVKATYWSVKASAPVIYKDAINAATSGTHTPVTVSGELRSGTTTTAGGFITVTPNGGTEAGTATASPVTIAPANGDGKTSYTVRLYDTASKTTLLDTQTIPVVFKGASGVNAINASLSNEADVLPASPEGVVSDYSGSGTEIRVFEGATELDYDGIGTANGKFNVTASATGITAGAKSESGLTCVFANASNMNADNATITFTITGKTANGSSFSLIKTQTFAKSRTGAKGDAGVSITGVDVEFAKNTNPTTAPTTGWATTAPAITGTEQLWTRTKTAYSSGSPTYSTPANITPRKGDTGTSISAVVEEYYLSTSNITQTGGSWSETPPTWVQGKYIWSRVKITYTNPSSTDTTTPYLSPEWDAINNTKLTAEQAQLAADGYMRARYIRDWSGRNTTNDWSAWGEVKVFLKNGTNIAQGKSVTGRRTQHATNVYSRVTDNDIGTSGQPNSIVPDGETDWVHIDLGQAYYDIDYIQVWHVWSDGRTYYGTKTEISEDGVNWTTVFDSAVSGTYKETEQGKIHSLRPDRVLAKLNTSAAITDKLGTTVTGGLINTVTMELREAGSETVTAGISGIQNGGNGVALWAGGTYAQAIAGTAKAIIRHDGTAKFTEAEVEGEVTAKEGKIGDMSIINGALTSNYSYFTYIGAAYVQVTVTMNLSQSGLTLTSSYGGTTDHPQVVTWTCEIGHTSIKVGSMEMRRDGIYRDGTKIL